MPRNRASVAGLAWVAAVSFVLCFVVLAATSPNKPSKTVDAKKSDAPGRTQPAPRRDLAPAQVVRTVVDALKNNDSRDSGIATAFAFASPSNKQITGPLDRFIPMVKSPLYSPLLNHHSAEFGPATVTDDAAKVRVTITDDKGNRAFYVFQLAKQTAGDLAGCWMTDGVMRLETAEEAGDPSFKNDSGRSADRA